MKRLALAVLAGLLSLPALAHEGHDAKPGAPAAPPPCTDVSLTCAKSATPALAADGRVWIVWSAANRIYVSASQDHGTSFAAPVAVSPVMEVLDDNSEARPKLILTPDGTLVVAFAQRVDKQYNGKIFTARSTDGGKSFSAPQPLQDGIGQRFETLGVAANGRIYAAWLDRRNQQSAKAAGQEYKDTGVAVAWSDDNGASFQGKAILADYSCDCCRLALTMDQDGLPVLAWRHVYGKNLRDHAVAKLSADGATLAPQRVSEDEWAIDACPRHGPSLTIDTAGAWHVTWYTKGARRQGLFYARSSDGGKTFSAPEALAPGRAASNPQILAAAGTLLRAWKEFDGAKTEILAQSSKDGGHSWSAAWVLATTADQSDHPLLVSDSGRTYLSWLTRLEGYRLLPVAAP
ncbi:BNR repeat-containing glycosyl hydrolase [Candidatus Terasakiella magnetica]|nr:BNR repeat-containing glycosyl hydrolase [Candidatus Terasakiella magnetica]